MYCSISDVRSRNANLLTLTTAPDAAVEETIEYADSIIDGSIADKYPIPLDSTPAIIKRISADLAAAELLSQVSGNQGGNEEPVQAQDLRKKAMDLLDRIASGKINLLIDSAPVAQNAGIRSTTYGVTRKFADWDPSDPSTFL